MYPRHNLTYPAQSKNMSPAKASEHCCDSAATANAGLRVESCGGCLYPALSPAWRESELRWLYPALSPALFDSLRDGRCPEPLEVRRGLRQLYKIISILRSEETNLSLFFSTFPCPFYPISQHKERGKHEYREWTPRRPYGAASKTPDQNAWQNSNRGSHHTSRRRQF